MLTNFGRKVMQFHHFNKDIAFILIVKNAHNYQNVKSDRKNPSFCCHFD